MAALKRYRQATKRRIYVEYLLLNEVNDRVEQAERLADVIAGYFESGVIRAMARLRSSPRSTDLSLVNAPFRRRLS